MFFHGNHNDLINSIEAIGASFAVFEYCSEQHLFTLVSCNSQYEDIIGQPTEDILNKPLMAIFPRYICKILNNALLQCRLEQTAVETEIIIEYKGIERYWRSIISPVIKKENQQLRIIQTCVEITEKKMLEKQLNLSMKRFQAVVQTAYDGIISIDEEQNIKLINEAAMEIFGYSRDELIGQPLLKLLPQKYRAHHGEYVDGFKSSRIDSRPMQSRASVRGLRKDGTEFPIEITISKINVAGNIEMTAVIRDISEKNKLMEELLKSSREDHLTQLANRRYFTEVINQEIKRLKRFKQCFSLLMIDIDYFKKINDAFGHECGDMVLMNFASLLRSNIRETDLVSRWGGEEFLLLLPGTNLQAGCEIAEKIRKIAEAQAFEYNTEVINYTISIGIQCIDDNHQEFALDAIVNSVDRCLYRAKSEGRNRFSSTPKNT